MKGQTQIKFMIVGLIIATISPIIGVYILDDDPTKKQDAIIYTFIPLSIGAIMMFISLRDSDEEKAQQNSKNVEVKS